MHRNYFIMAILVLFVLLACEKGNKNKTKPRLDSLAVRMENPKKAQAPAWFQNTPAKKNVLFAKGEAKSHSRTIAREKAIMNAQIALAESLKEESGLKPDSINVSLRFSHIVKEQSVKKGQQWHHYVLMEYPKH